MDLEAIASMFGAGPVASNLGFGLPRYNLAPGQDIPAVLQRDNRTEILGLRWGLVPAWADDAKIGFSTFNARSETAHEKPTFKDAFRHRRCLIPATGFYEWKKGPADSKQPYAASRKFGQPFAMAGLWETWKNPTNGDRLESCTVLTCPANTRLRALHERMPVILPPVDWTMWLDPRVEGEVALRSMCKPDDSRVWSFYPVSTRVNRVKNEGLGLLDEAMDESGGLFG